MLERLLFRHLTKKGKIGYFLGVLVLFALWAYYVLGIAGYSMDEGRTMFMIGIIVLNIIWAGVCLLLWRLPKEEKNENQSNSEV